MKYQLLICAVAVVASSALPRRPTNYYTAGPTPTYLNPFVQSSTIVARSPSSQLYDNNSGSTLPLGKIIGNSFISQEEVATLVSNGLTELLRTSLGTHQGPGIEGMKHVSVAILATVRQNLETQVANGIHVSEEQLEAVQGVEERVSAIFGALTDTFGENKDPLSSVEVIVNRFELDAVERSNFYARIVPTVLKIVSQVTEASTTESLVDIYNICLVAMKEALEHRAANGRPLTDENRANLAASERINTLLKRVYTPVVTSKLMSDFIRSMKFNPQEKAKFIVSGLYATLNAIYRNADAPASKLIDDITLIYLSEFRMIINDRLAQGKPVNPENLYKLQELEKSVPFIVESFTSVVDKPGIK